MTGGNVMFFKLAVAALMVMAASPTIAMVDLSEYAKPGAPDHLLIFGNGAFIPECR